MNSTIMKKKNAAVFLNGELELDEDFFRRPENDYSTFNFFCADGGANHAIKLGIKPVAVLGDLDSIKAETLDQLGPDTKFINYPVDKDKTDSQLLLEYLYTLNYRNIHIFAATGGHTDHFLANIFLLLKFPGSKIINRNETITIATNHTQILGCKNHGLSLIPLSNMVKGLRISGCKFNLDNTDISRGSSLTMSNIIDSDVAELNFISGKLLMVITKDNTVDT